MKFYRLSAISLLLLLAPLALAQEEAAAEVEAGGDAEATDVVVTPLGVSVGSATLEDMDFSIRPGTMQPGLRVHVLLAGFADSAVLVDVAGSSVTACVDSTGLDLLKPVKRERRGMMTPQAIGPFPRVSDDGQMVTLEVVAPRVPGEGASWVAVQGQVRVLTASGTRTVRSAVVKPTKQSMTVGDAGLTLQGAKPSEWQEGKTELALGLTKGVHQRIKTMRVLDEKGKVLAEGPSSTMTMGEAVTVTMMLDAKPGSLMLEFELYEGLSAVLVPMDLKVGLGLSVPADGEEVEADAGGEP